MAKLNCLICDKELYGIQKKFCSIECKGLASRKTKPPCLICGELCNRPKSKTCSIECHKKLLQINRKQYISKDCLQCKKPLTRDQLKDPRTKYCSPDCAYTALTGIKRSVAFCENLSQKLTGRIFSSEHISKITNAACLRGIEQRKKTRVWLQCPECSRFFNKLKSRVLQAVEPKCSVECFGASRRLPDFQKHYPEIWNESLRETIRVRDNRTCSVCKLAENQLDQKMCVHHIDHNKSNCNHSNLISMCRECHNESHYSNQNFWKQILKSKVDDIVRTA